MTPTDGVEIDGAHGEGGGQVLRTSLALSAILSRPVRLTRIRAGRRNPGLAPQHLATVRAVAAICDADMRGAALGSQALTFTPRTPPQSGAYAFDVTDAAQGGSAGAVTLIFQTLLLPLALASGPSHLILRGGTHVPWSPPYPYLAHVCLPTLRRLGLDATTTLDTPGFYPVGGGQMRADIAGGQRLAPLTLTERGPLRRMWGETLACNLPADIAQRIANRARNVLARAGLDARIQPRRERGPGPGAFVFLLAEYEHTVAGFSALGERGKPSEQVADEVCEALLAFHGQDAPVDSHLADQLLLPLALASGASEFRASAATGHLITNVHVIQQFLPLSIDVDGAAQMASIRVTPR